MKIGLVGNPNSGKTTLFNLLTGANEKVGNWGGVTVAKREGLLKAVYAGTCGKVDVVDLPGAYSISPYTSEESITSDFITKENPDVIINIIDSTNLGRSLFFSSQILELGIPTVLALNKSDLASKKGVKIDTAALASKLNCTVVEITAETSKGIDVLCEKALAIVGNGQKAVITDAEDEKRFNSVEALVSKIETRATKTAEKTFSDKVDAVIAHKILGLPIFAAVMYAVFHISQTWLGPMVADFLCGYIEMFAEFISTFTSGASPLLQSLISGAIVDGVGAVVGFLPLIMIMMFLISLLEDSGYIARVAVIMDVYFKKVGLSGKSIIPIIVGTACAIPGVMAARTIKDDRERATASMLTPFIPCGAKLPVIALFAGVFFGGAAWVSTLMYFMGIGLIIVGALIIKAITGTKYKKNYFIIEMPEYKLPSLKMACKVMCARGWAFVVKAGTIILLCNVAVSVMQNFDLGFHVLDLEGNPALADHSILAKLATPFAFIMIPLGFGTWQLAAAAVTGFIAKENVVGTLATVFCVGNFIDAEALELVSEAGAATGVAGVMGLTQVAALAYLAFNMFTPPCFAAMGAMNAEMTEKKWVWGALGLQLGFGYIVAFLINQIGSLIAYGTFSLSFFPGLLICAAIVAYITYLIKKAK